MPTRRLMTKGLHNARDLGGFPTADGRVTRFGVFVRSEAPCGLSEEDIAYLRNYGITASMDFRSTGEMQARPSDLSEAMTYYHRPLFNEAAMGKGPGGPPKGGPGAGPGGFSDWGESYIHMAEDSREWAVDALTLAADNPGGMLYHCTTGKDRTGIMTCYLLSIAGVGREDIAADYCVSQLYLEPVFAKMRSGQMRMSPPEEEREDSGDRPGPAMSEWFFQTPASAMLTLMDYLTEHYGGVVEYLRLAGVPEQVMDRIRDKLVEFT